MTTYRMRLAALICALLLIFPILCAGVALNVRAATAYSDVLEDLRTDEDFDPKEYPEIADDFSLQIIQIAESTDGELLIYVYQPGSSAYGYKASSINIAREPDNSINLNFENYWLSYLNRNGVFYKYKVVDFEVNSDPARYYNISNILRPWDNNLDDKTGNDNTISEVPYTVSQYWTVTGTGETVSYHMKTSEVIVIEDKYVGYVYYSDGSKLKWNSISLAATNAHFVAFSTDRQIDKLKEVKLTYAEQTVNCKYCSNVTHTLLSNSHDYKQFYNYSYSDPIPKTKTINYKDKGGNSGGGNIVKADPYCWDRIRTTADFLADENNKDYVLTSAATNNIKNTQWVLSFAETPYYQKTSDLFWGLFIPLGWAFVGEVDVQFSKVSEVMILELEFETDGQTYRLGVVDNKQTSGSDSSNEPRAKSTSTAWWVWLLVALGVVAIILVLICIFVPGAAPVIGRIVFTIIWWIISLPYQIVRGFAFLVARRRQRKATAAAKSRPRNARNKSKSRSKKK